MQGGTHLPTTGTYIVVETATSVSTLKPSPSFTGEYHTYLLISTIYTRGSTISLF